MKQRKLLAMGMATLMAMSSTVMAVAADETSQPATGKVDIDGTLEGYVDLDVFTVTLPTTNTMAFKIDPQGLLFSTIGSSNLKVGDSEDAVSAPTDKTYAENILFKSTKAGAGDNDYVTKSAPITIVNKSTFAVDVTVEAKLSGLTKTGENGYDVKVVDPSAVEDGKTFKFGDETAIYMSLTPTPGTIADTTITAGTPAAASYLTSDAKGVKIVNTVDPVDDALDTVYDIKKGGDGKYTCTIKADVSSIDFKEVSYTLSGKVNTAADWTNFSKDETAKLSVAVTYSVSKHSDAPASPLSVSTISTANNSFTFTLPEGATAIKSMVASKVAGGTVTLTTTHYKLSGNTVTITNTNLLNPATYSKITVTFNDTSLTAAELTVQ